MIVYVTHSIMYEYIMEGEITEKRANWITKILKYDIEVKPTKTVQGRGLCEYLMHDEEMANRRRAAGASPNKRVRV